MSHSKNNELLAAVEANIQRAGQMQAKNAKPAMAVSETSYAGQMDPKAPGYSLT